MTATRTPTTPPAPQPDRPHGIDRRTALTSASVLAAGSALLAACGSGESQAGAGASTGSSTSSSASPSATASASTSVPTTPATSETSSEPAATATSAGGTPIVQLADVPVGGAVSAKLDGKNIIVAQPSAGTVVGFDSTCTHRGCQVMPAGEQLNCACHNSDFALATGEPLSGPAPTALAKVSVKVEGGAVVAGA